MSRKVNISIPKPCHENWEAMTPEDKGRFCSVCTKTVFDFTKASDKEIMDQLKKDATTCGRLHINQLNRNLVISKQKPKYWAVFSVTVFGLLGLGNHVAYSQVKHDTIQTEPKEDLILGKVRIPQKRMINGVVSDGFGPIAGVKVVVKNSEKNTITDSNGNYSIEAEIGDEIVFSYFNKIEKIIISNNNSKYDVILVFEMGQVVVLGNYKKRTFFGRQIQKIRNWFR